MTTRGVAARVADALLTHLDKLIVGNPPLPIAMPGVSFPGKDHNGDELTMPTNYLRASFLPNEPETVALTFGDTDRHQGLLQVSVFWKSDDGLFRPFEAVSAVIEHFARGTVLDVEDQRVRIIRNPWASQPIVEADRVQIPVTIPWTCFAS